MFLPCSSGSQLKTVYLFRSGFLAFALTTLPGRAGVCARVCASATRSRFFGLPNRCFQFSPATSVASRRGAARSLPKKLPVGSIARGTGIKNIMTRSFACQQTPRLPQPRHRRFPHSSLFDPFRRFVAGPTIAPRRGSSILSAALEFSQTIRTLDRISRMLLAGLSRSGEKTKEYKSIDADF